MAAPETEPEKRERNNDCRRSVVSRRRIVGVRRTWRWRSGRPVSWPVGIIGAVSVVVIRRGSIVGHDTRIIVSAVIIIIGP